MASFMEHPGHAILNGFSGVLCYITSVSIPILSYFGNLNFGCLCICSWYFLVWSRIKNVFNGGSMTILLGTFGKSIEKCTGAQVFCIV